MLELLHNSVYQKEKKGKEKKKQSSLFCPLKREPEKLHTTRVHGIGDPRLWHLARLDSERFMEG